MNAGAAFRPLLIVLEGINDIEFLLRLSQRLHAERAHIANLTLLHAQGQILFVPTGGGNFREWAVRFQSLGCREFYLLDREVGPETDRRQQAVQLVNTRPGCSGFLTSKRSLENYLHCQAIAEAGGGEIQFGDYECVGSVLACHWYELVPQRTSWHSLSRRARRRLVYRAKRWLNRQAVDRMSATLLAQRDPAGEVVQWLTMIAQMTTAVP